MSQRTLLSSILDRMNRWDSIVQEEEQYKIRDLDEALRALRRSAPMPWVIQKGSLRVFEGVLEYPTATDHDELAFFDNNTQGFGSKPRFRFTSIQEFYEDLDYRNDIAEIWDGNDRFLGVRYDTKNASSVSLNNAETVGDWSVSGDATSVALDSVVFKEGNGSMRVAITSSAATATIKNTLTSNQTDSLYKRKYHFKKVYLDAVPTSIKMRYQVDDSNYLETTGITTQFSGQALKADAWNLIAHDLNTAVATGTVATTAVFTSEKIILLGAATGTYYFDASHVRQWELLDYWYYSKFSIALVGSTTGNQEYFFNSSGVYSTDSQLIGDSEWVDAVMYEALNLSATNKENNVISKEFKDKKVECLGRLALKYPDMVPIVITQRWVFNTEPGRDVN